MERIIKKDILVVTPTLGYRKSLGRTVQSVEKYGSNRIKHILTCPQSKLKELREKFADLEVIPEPKDKKGIYFALNNAIKKHARHYKYFTFINDDDYWLPGFKKLILALDENQALDAVYGRTVFVSETNEIIGEQTSSSRYKSFKLLLTKRIVLFTQQATLIKSELFYKINGFDESYKLVADSKFWAQAIDFGAQFCYVNTLAAAYTLQEDQLSSDKKTQREEYVKLLNEEMFRSVSFFKVLFEIVIFRLTNTRIYLKKYLKI